MTLVTTTRLCSQTNRLERAYSHQDELLQKSHSHIKHLLRFTHKCKGSTTSLFRRRSHIGPHSTALFILGMWCLVMPWQPETFRLSVPLWVSFVRTQCFVVVKYLDHPFGRVRTSDGITIFKLNPQGKKVNLSGWAISVCRIDMHNLDPIVRIRF